MILLPPYLVFYQQKEPLNLIMILMDDLVWFDPNLMIIILFKKLAKISFTHLIFLVFKQLFCKTNLEDFYKSS